MVTPPPVASRTREEEKVAILLASPRGNSEPSSPFSQAASPHSSSVLEQAQQDMFHTMCKPRYGVPGAKEKRRCCFHTSTSLMHSAINISRHAHPGKMLRALSNVIKAKKRFVGKQYHHVHYNAACGVHLHGYDQSILRYWWWRLHARSVHFALHSHKGLPTHQV